MNLLGGLGGNLLGGGARGLGTFNAIKDLLDTVYFGQFDWKLMLPVKVLNSKQVEFNGIMGNGFGQMGNEINQSDFRGREKWGTGGSLALAQGKMK